ncbi:MAG: hypothetical protein CM1200mP41_11400 [Gammaproteobacteria bacterium]|nr:MAG: hypothetical protein CM1200mP41_11400 [Gammaproteobacteria bacterium]
MGLSRFYCTRHGNRGFNSATHAIRVQTALGQYFVRCAMFDMLIGKAEVQHSDAVPHRMRYSLTAEPAPPAMTFSSTVTNRS